MKNYLSIPILGLLVCGCSVTGSLQRRHAGAALAHTPKVMRHEARREQAPPQYIEIRHTDGRPTEFFVPAVTLENGEQVMMMELDEVVVTARTRSLPERMGKVDIDFVVTLPKTLQGSCRNIVVTPVLYNRGGRTPLEDISIRGALFDKVQQRDYWQYGRYIDLYRPDSLRAQEAFDRFVRFPYPQDVRCDSVRASRSDISYYYTQTVPTADAGKRLSVTLEGRVEGLDGSLYLLPPSDTLSYTISSMLDFVDTTTRYLTHIIERRVRLDDRVLLAFPVGSAAIVDTLSGNAAQLMKTGVVLERLFGQLEFTVDSISVTAFASPEGGAAMNRELSRRRAQTLSNYLKERFPDDAGLDTLVAIRSAGEDWTRLREMVHGDSLIRNRERILELIDTEPNSDRRERLIRETMKDVSLRVTETDSTDAFNVAGRGEMSLSILIETMRREGYELQVSPPRVLYQEIDGVKCEPIERLVVDVPSDCVGAVMEKIGSRKGDLVEMTPVGDRMKVEFLVPARGLFGYRNEFLTDTKGEGIMASVFDSYAPMKGEIQRRNTGSLVAFETGEAVTYGLFNAQERGVLFIGAGTPVYAGMVVGETPKAEDISVNVCKKKQLTNMRASGSDDALRLIPPRQMSLEQCLEFLADDELLECTPENLRLRKRILDHGDRMKALKGGQK